MVTLFRLLLALIIIVGILYLLQKLRPKPSYIVTLLEYPRQAAVSLAEPGEYVELWPSPNGQSIYVYKQGMPEGDGLLGQLPARYFAAVESVLRKGQLYEAVIAERTGNSVRVEIKLKVRQVPEEFV